MWVQVAIFWNTCSSLFALTFCSCAWTYFFLPSWVLLGWLLQCILARPVNRLFLLDSKINQHSSRHSTPCDSQLSDNCLLSPLQRKCPQFGLLVFTFCLFNRPYSLDFPRSTALYWLLDPESRTSRDGLFFTTNISNVLFSSPFSHLESF